MEATVSSFVHNDKTGHKIKFEDKRTVMQCVPHDPFGFWKFSWETGGELPTSLSGNFTSWMEAEKHLKAYLNGKEVEEKKVEEKAAKAAEVEAEINAKSDKAREEWKKTETEKMVKHGLAKEAKEKK
jgi:hypothetical protein